jgi:hypothetical protein
MYVCSMYHVSKKARYVFYIYLFNLWTYMYGRMEVVFFAALLLLLVVYQYPGTRCAPLNVFNFGQSEGPQVVNLF